MIPKLFRWTGRLSNLALVTAGATALTLFAISLSVPYSYAQQTSAATHDEVTWPTTFTIGFGAAANGNWQSSGTFSTGDATNDAVNQNLGYTGSSMAIRPEFHVLAEIPIGTDWMFAPRIAYNDLSLSWTGTPPLAISQSELGADLLVKYALSNFHVMGGANLATPISGPKYTHASSNISDASTTLPNTASFLASLKAGAGYDIPLNAKHDIWLTPEAFLTYPLTNFLQNSSSSHSLLVATVSAGASLKFGLGGGTPPPAPTPVVATITAHGVLPDGSVVAEPVSPQQAVHTRASIPLLPYIFFDDGSAVISSRYTRSGATGYSEKTALAGKSALDANHQVLDITGERMRNDPSMTVRITGTNSNARDEKNNIGLSKARAMAVADYLKNTWGIDGSRITIDQRNLPELPTNPVTKAGMEENRRVEISSSNSDLTAPVKIEDRSNLSVGQTQIRYDMTISPDPSVHNYTNWTITLDKDGVQVGSPISGTGAPPASTTADIPNPQRFMNQPIHFSLSVTDDQGQTAHAEGFTRITAKTVDRDNLERYGMLSFDFDKADINARARQMLQLISESISRDATGVKIDGFCDSTGSAEYNQTLSEARANSAVTALRSMTSLPANVTVHGHGLRDPKFSNDLPEGRQLNRRVEFTIDKSSQ